MRVVLLPSTSSVTSVVYCWGSEGIVGSAAAWQGDQIDYVVVSRAWTTAIAMSASKRYGDMARGEGRRRLRTRPGKFKLIE